LSCGDKRVYLEVALRRVECRSCAKVKREKLDWLAANPFYTKRFAFFVGRRCRASTIKDVAKELHLDWQTVKGAARTDSIHFEPHPCMFLIASGALGFLLHPWSQARVLQAEQR
jgi:transposase